MLSFTRLTSFFLVLLSLSFLVCALPTSVTESKALAARADAGEGLLDILVNFHIKIQAILKLLVDVHVITEIQPHILAITLLLKDCTAAILALGVNVQIDVAVVAKIVAEVVAIIHAILEVCAQLSVKFGLIGVIGIIVQLDLALQALLIQLNLCIVGILQLIVKALVQVDIESILALKLTLLAQLLRI